MNFKLEELFKKRQIIALLVISGLSLAGFAKERYENIKLVEAVKNQMAEMEKEKIKNSSAFFQVGCEMGFTLMEKAAKDESEAASLQITLYPLKMQCASMADTLLERLQEEEESARDK